MSTEPPPTHGIDSLIADCIAGDGRVSIGDGDRRLDAPGVRRAIDLGLLRVFPDGGFGDGEIVELTAAGRNRHGLKARKDWKSALIDIFR